MKKIILVFLLLICFLSYAQEDKRNSNDMNYNEIKLNGLMAVVAAFEVTYERTLNEESGLGISMLVPYDSEDTSLNYYISPYYRVYFGKNYAAGFFVEGFGMLSSEEYLSSVTVQNNITLARTEDALDFALGIGIGGKWISKSGFVGELSLGVGRNLFNSDKTGTEAVGKVGITIGYRF